MLLLRLLAFALGIAVVAVTVFSAVETLVLPRGAPNVLSRVVFRGVRVIFDLFVRGRPTYLARDRTMSFYAPVALITLLPAWLVLAWIGYTLVYWAIDLSPLGQAARLSGSSLLTLGFATAGSFGEALVSFSEATVGLLLVALLIAYLPTMYAAFSRREAAVTLLEVRAGNPPAPVEMIKRYHRIHGLSRLNEQWRSWEVWFADVEESHTALAALVFFRSPQPEHSWLTAAGAVLDAAALTVAVVDVPHDPQADLCIRAGYLALRHISDFFDIAYDPDPLPSDPISVTRAEFDAACDELAGAGVPLREDRELAWRDFAGWRVNYDTVLRALAGLTMAPSSPWVGDRPTDHPLPPLIRWRR